VAKGETVTPALRTTGAALDAAGMTLEDGGLLGAAFLPSARPIVWPRVWLDGDHLCYGLDAKHPGAGPKEGDARGMLDRFWRIEQPKQVLAFASRYGVLGICEHGLPASHNPERLAGPGTAEREGCRPPRAETAELVYLDPLQRWLHYARLARSLLDVAAALADGRPGAPSQWEAIFEDHLGTAAEPAARERVTLLSRPDAVPQGRFYLAYLVNEWLAIGRVGMRFRWPMDRDAPELPTLAAGTFGLIGMQLAFAIARADLRRCSSCGRRYPRTGRQPTRSRRNFCPDCQGKAANSLRQRELRALDQKIIRLRDAARPRTAIARELGIDPERVAAALRRRDRRRRQPGLTR
jgi:hypothetical protein